jgi:ABC-type phosphate transport system auxiliary subunit
VHLGGCNLLTIDVEIRIIRSMGDAGEGLVDAESRLAERMDEREEEKKKARQIVKAGDPERARQLESCRLARTEMQRQLDLATHQARRQQLDAAIAELDRRITQLSKK